MTGTNAAPITGIRVFRLPNREDGHAHVSLFTQLDERAAQLCMRLDHAFIGETRTGANYVLGSVQEWEHHPYLRMIAIPDVGRQHNEEMPRALVTVAQDAQDEEEVREDGPRNNLAAPRLLTTLLRHLAQTIADGHRCLDVVIVPDHGVPTLHATPIIRRALLGEPLSTEYPEDEAIQRIDEVTETAGEPLAPLCAITPDAIFVSRSTALLCDILLADPTADDPVPRLRTGNPAAASAVHRFNAVGALRALRLTTGAGPVTSRVTAIVERVDELDAWVTIAALRLDANAVHPVHAPRMEPIAVGLFDTSETRSPSRLGSMLATHMKASGRYPGGDVTWTLEIDAEGALHQATAARGGVTWPIAEADIERGATKAALASAALTSGTLPPELAAWISGETSAPMSDAAIAEHAGAASRSLGTEDRTHGPDDRTIETDALIGSEYPDGWPNEWRAPFERWIDDDDAIGAWLRRDEIAELRAPHARRCLARRLMKLHAGADPVDPTPDGDVARGIIVDALDEARAIAETSEVDPLLTAADAVGSGAEKKRSGSENAGQENDTSTADGEVAAEHPDPEAAVGTTRADRGKTSEEQTSGSERDSPPPAEASSARGDEEAPSRPTPTSSDPPVSNDESRARRSNESTTNISSSEANQDEEDDDGTQGDGSSAQDRHRPKLAHDVTAALSGGGPEVVFLAGSPAPGQEAPTQDAVEIEDGEPVALGYDKVKSEAMMMMMMESQIAATLDLDEAGLRSWGRQLAGSAGKAVMLDPATDRVRLFLSSAIVKSVLIEVIQAVLREAGGARAPAVIPQQILDRIEWPSRLRAAAKRMGLSDDTLDEHVQSVVRPIERKMERWSRRIAEIQAEAAGSPLEDDPDAELRRGIVNSALRRFATLDNEFGLRVMDAATLPNDPPLDDLSLPADWWSMKPLDLLAAIQPGEKAHGSRNDADRTRGAESDEGQSGSGEERDGGEEGHPGDEDRRFATLSAELGWTDDRWQRLAIAKGMFAEAGRRIRVRAHDLWFQRRRAAASEETKITDDADSAEFEQVAERAAQDEQIAAEKTTPGAELPSSAAQTPDEPTTGDAEPNRGGLHGV